MDSCLSLEVKNRIKVQCSVWYQHNTVCSAHPLARLWTKLGRWRADHAHTGIQMDWWDSRALRINRSSYLHVWAWGFIWTGRLLKARSHIWMQRTCNLLLCLCGPVCLCSTRSGDSVYTYKCVCANTAARAPSAVAAGLNKSNWKLNDARPAAVRGTAQLPCLKTYQMSFEEIGTRPDWNSYPEHSRWVHRGQVWGFNKECADPEWWIHSTPSDVTGDHNFISANMKFRFKANGQKVTMARVCRACGGPPCICAASKDNLGKKNISMYKLSPKTCGFPRLASNLWPEQSGAECLHHLVAFRLRILQQ